ncbi:transcriptional regulator [Flavobacterium tegetincola]|uniref:transcriptional regulator n=1 Tax=Flavobacterium tegetincola TaxID=150172 RepID=UPI00047B1024|nr:transcriptional regulator [Flavobacterium tegetincola]
MNYIKHLTGFFEKVVLDKNLNPTHVSLYIALFQFWNCNRFRNPISISRDEVMRISKISSKATYHKCMKNLHQSGYIDYQPSFNPFRGSHVVLFNFSDNLRPELKAERSSKNEPISYIGVEQVVNNSCTTSETSTEQALVPYINNTNIINNSNIENSLNKSQQAKINETSEPDFLETEAKTEKEKKLRKKKKDDDEAQLETSVENIKVKKHFIVPGIKSEKPNTNFKPTQEEIKSYFAQEKFPDLEAQKFYNYFASIGWLVGGRTPMQNWQAAAQNWMLNANKFTKESHAPPKPKTYLNATTEKNYAEPL